MDTRIDKFGRIVIPKAIREHLGLKTGSLLHVEESGHDIVLKVADHESPIKIKNGIAVYMGKALDDIDDAIEEERDLRSKKLGGY